MQHKVIFQPSGRRGMVEEGTTIKEASRLLGVDIESRDEVRRIFLEPRVEPSVELRFRDPDPDGVRRMLCGEHTFSPDRIEAALDKFEKARAGLQQESLDRWFG